jgi:hypothetical protein
MWFVLLSHCNIGCTNPPQCDVIRTVSVFSYPEGFFGESNSVSDWMFNFRWYFTKTFLSFLVTYKVWSLRSLLRTTYTATVCRVCVPLAQYPSLSRCRHYSPHHYFSFQFGMLPSFVKKLGTCPVIYWLLPVLTAVLGSSPVSCTTNSDIERNISLSSS